MQCASIHVTHVLISQGKIWTNKKLPHENYLLYGMRKSRGNKFISVYKACVYSLLTAFSHPLYQFTQRAGIVVLSWSEEWPVDSTNNILHTHRLFRLLKVDVFINDRKDALFVRIGHVQLIGTVFWANVLLRDNGNQALATVQATPNCSTPITIYMWVNIWIEEACRETKNKIQKSCKLLGLWMQ